MIETRGLYSTAVVLSFALTGCDRPVNPVEPTNDVDLPAISAEQSVDVPPEFETAPSIFDYWTDAGFSGTGAYGQGFMKFFANRARQRLTLSVREGGTTIGTQSGLKHDGWFLPRLTTQWVDATTFAGGFCGHTVGASTIHEAWFQIPYSGGILKWGETARSSGDEAQQPPCSGSCAGQIIYDPDAPCEDDSGSGGGGSGGGDGGGGGGDLDCSREWIMLEVEGEVIYEGWADICE